MPRSDHYAIVVGVTQYPRLGTPPPDLQGPANDADAVFQWLTAADGGDLPVQNVTLIKPSGHLKPSREEIEEAFLALNDIAAANQANGEGRHVGERLYLYASGHGFSPVRNKGCLFAANASADAPGLNVFASAWLELFQDAGYFREFILWMDCCMNRLPSATPSAPTLTAKTVLEPPGATFVAFAARRPLKAVERPVAEHAGAYHGVFTWNLLQGLKGAAVNPYGMVTGRSLADWLRNAQRGRLGPEDLDDPEVAKEPEIVDEDEDLIFARGLAPMTFKATLKFPADAAGAEARLWRGRPPRPETVKVGKDGTTPLELPPGLYVADVPSKGLRCGFEVTCDGEVDGSIAGAAVAPPQDQLLDLVITPDDAGSEVFIVDEAFHLVDRAARSLATRLPFGIYKVRIRSGRRLTEQTLMLDQPISMVGSAAPQLPAFSSAAPLHGTAATHEYQQAAAQQAASQSAGGPDVVAGAGAEMMVMVRCWTRDDEVVPPDFEPWKGVRVVDAKGKVVADLEHDGRREMASDPFATCTLALNPGAWFLRQPAPDGGELEQCLIVSPNWRTDAYVLVRPSYERGLASPRVSVLMHAPGSPWEDPVDIMIDQARVALADERFILSGELEEVLINRCDTPMAGIIGGHLLLVEQARWPSGRIAKLNDLVRKLRSLVGDHHPDVEALSLRCPNEALRATRPLHDPPMFEASWRLWVDASQHRSSILPKSLWGRVHAQVLLPPYLIWSADEQAKQRHREQLQEILTRRPTALESAAAEVAAQMETAESGGHAPGSPEGVAAAVARAAVAELGSSEQRHRIKVLGLPPAALKAI